MIQTLVLVRHGKAKRGSYDLPDIERPLTKAGRAALAAPDGFPAIFTRLDEGERAAAEIWVSPALRALQTAECITQAIGERPLIEHESLWEQDAVAFLEELAAYEARCVIAVGHVPFMNEMLAWLTGDGDGSCPSFSPGSVAAIRMAPYTDARGLGGSLLWFAPGPKA